MVARAKEKPAPENPARVLVPSVPIQGVGLPSFRSPNGPARRQKARNAHRHSHAHGPGHDHGVPEGTRKVRSWWWESSVLHSRSPSRGSSHPLKEEIKKAPLDVVVRGICVGNLHEGRGPNSALSRHFRPLFDLGTHFPKPGGGKRPTNPSAILRHSSKSSCDGIYRKKGSRSQSPCPTASAPGSSRRPSPPLLSDHPTSCTGPDSRRSTLDTGPDIRHPPGHAHARRYLRLSI